ncbi:MAG: 4-phosphoerythronate dehydrogenase PdxB [bacterium]
MKIVADENIPLVREVFGQLGDISTVNGRKINSAQLKHADLLLVRSVTKVNNELLKDSSVSFVGTATIGTDHIDIEYLKNRHIEFASAPGSNANSVGEYIITALLVIAQKKSFKLKDKTIGIIGAGNTGSSVEQKSRALGMKVFLNDPPLKRATGNPKYLELNQLLSCDIITCHVPLNKNGKDKTYHLADEIFFKSLRRGVIFINASRGAVADNSALLEYIKNGHLGGCVLDVWENEPQISNELLKAVDIGTPHIAGYSYDGKVKGTEMLYNSACSFFNKPIIWNPKEFMPEAPCPAVLIDNTHEPPQALLHASAVKVYNITEDYELLCKGLEMPSEEQASYFDKLRKEYPKRREFHNTEVKLRKNCDNLGKMLKGLGFKVNS